MISSEQLSRFNQMAMTLTWDCSFIEKGSDLKMLHNGGVLLMKFEILDGHWLEVNHNACEFGDMAKWKVGDLITLPELFDAVKFAKAPSTVS